MAHSNVKFLKLNMYGFSARNMLENRRYMYPKKGEYLLGHNMASPSFLTCIDHILKAIFGQLTCGPRKFPLSTDLYLAKFFMWLGNCYFDSCREDCRR